MPIDRAAAGRQCPGMAAVPLHRRVIAWLLAALLLLPGHASLSAPRAISERDVALRVLAELGGTLCHGDAGTERDTPAAPMGPECRLCILCAGTAPPSGSVAAPPPLPRPGLAAVPARVAPYAPRAPPAAHHPHAQPRAPPISV